MRLIISYLTDITNSPLQERKVPPVKLIKTLPNALSVSRVIASPFLVSLTLQGRWNCAFILLVVIVMSDAFDGEVARKLGVASELGRALDTAGDITYSVAVLVGLFLTKVAPSWFAPSVACYAVIVISRIVFSENKAGRVLGCVAMPLWLTLLAYMIWRYGTLGGASSWKLAISELFAFLMVAYWKRARLKKWMNSR